MHKGKKRLYRGKIIFNVTLFGAVLLITLLIMFKSVKAALVCLCFFSVLLVMLQRNQRLYLKKILSSMEKISKGNLNMKVPVEGDDELTVLALSLNLMTDDLRMFIEKERSAQQGRINLVTNVAHDLRTPMTSIIGYLELLKDNPGMDEATRIKYTSIALDKAGYLKDMTNELFEFAKLSQRRRVIDAENLDMVKLLEQVADELYPVLEKNNMTCEIASQGLPAMIMGDGNLLARLFDNLLNNAVKYGRNGSKIIVRVHGTASCVTVSVTNYGEVIPKEEIPLIFNKFYRVDQSRSVNIGGTGLGLAIVKNIALMHGGSVECSSDEALGTCFTVRLPVIPSGCLADVFDRR